MAWPMANRIPGAMPELLDVTVWLSKSFCSIGCVLRA